jgi:hypothetical protein
VPEQIIVQKYGPVLLVMMSLSLDIRGDSRASVCLMACSRYLVQILGYTVLTGFDSFLHSLQVNCSIIC